MESRLRKGEGEMALGGPWEPLSDGNLTPTCWSLGKRLMNKAGWVSVRVGGLTDEGEGLADHHGAVLACVPQVVGQLPPPHRQQPGAQVGQRREHAVLQVT